MKVLLLTDEYQRYDSIGGGDVMTQRIAVGLQSRGHSVGICCNWGVKEDRVLRKDIMEYRILCPKRVWKSAAFLSFYRHLLADRWGIRSVISQFHPDIIFCLHQRGIAVPTISFVNRLSVPIVYRMGDEWLRLHYYADKYDMKKYWNNKNIHSIIRLAISAFAGFVGGNTGLFSRPDFAAHFVVFNSADLSHRAAKFIKSDCKMRVIRNGVDLNMFRFRFRDKLNSTRLLYVGRLVSHKGVHLLPKMMDQLLSSRRLKDATLTIVGSSDETEYICQLKRAVVEMGLSSYINFVGVVPWVDMPQYYNEHDILIFPTPFRHPKFTVEGCPSVLVEAMACGLPIVARIIPGIDEVVTDGKTCIGVYKDSPEALACAVEKITSDPELYRHLSKTGRVQAEHAHSLESMTEKIESVLRTAIDDSKSAYSSFRKAN